MTNHSFPWYVCIVIFINHYLPICLDLPLARCPSWGVNSSSCLMLLCTILDSCWDHIHNAEIVLHSWLCPLAKIFLMFSQPMRSHPYDNNWPNRGKDSDILVLPFIVITWTQITTRKSVPVCHSTGDDSMSWMIEKPLCAIVVKTLLMKDATFVIK